MSIKIPLIQTPDRITNQIQSNFSNALYPVLNNPLNEGIILKNQTLGTGSNTINHTLGRTLQGWFIVRQRASASIYDLQDTNTNPTKTLLLNSSGQVVVDVFVF